MPTDAAKSEEFYQRTAQELQKQSRARAAVWLAKQGRGEKRKPADCTKRAEHFVTGYTKTGAKGKTVKCHFRKREKTRGNARKQELHKNKMILFAKSLDETARIC